MTDFLEAFMMVCFGLSWPINLVKNYKSGTAKSTSLNFLILIISGYVAGIVAKIIGGRINYVFWVYVINIIFVSMNLVVYFINKRKDKLADNKN